MIAVFSTPKSNWPAIGAILVSILSGTVAISPAAPFAQEEEVGAGPSIPPPVCHSYADCPKGMICAGAGGGATGSCLWPNQLPRPHMAYDPLPKGYMGSIYGQPIIQGEPPAGAPRSDAGGTWDMKTGTYRPPRGGKWSYHPGGNNGFGGVWSYEP